MSYAFLFLWVLAIPFFHYWWFAELEGPRRYMDHFYIAFWPFTIFVGLFVTICMALWLILEEAFRWRQR